MKKILYFIAVVLITTGCATGYYAPHNVNQFGAQTQVVLDKANFRIVRNIEVVIDINNTNLKRADVEKSAYAELLRRANVVIEEVRREHMNIFRVLFSGLPKVTQHVAARATIIEFINADGSTVSSSSVTNSGTAPRKSQIEQKPEDPRIARSILGNYNPDNIKFADKDFMDACLAFCDSNSDNILDLDEVLAVKDLDVSSWGIKNMAGIELFQNLETLTARNNSFEVLNLTKNKNLKKISVKSRNIKTVYVPKETKSLISDINPDMIIRK